TTQHLDVRGLPGQEGPSRPGSKGLGIALEDLWRVVRGIQGDRIQEDVAPHARAERRLDARQVRGRDGAELTTAREHEVDRDDLALYEIVVEPYTAALVGDQGDVGQVLRADEGHPVRRARHGP